MLECRNVKIGKIRNNYSEVQVESSKFFMHENFCKRNYTHCKDCKEVVEIISLDEHNRQKHVDFPCSFCKKLYKKFAIKDHMDVCPRQLIQCSYCELEVEGCELNSHLKNCGSHTDSCSFCLKTFLVRELNGHLRLCGKNPENLNKHKKNNYQDNGFDSKGNSNLNSFTCGTVDLNKNQYNLDGLDFETMDLIKRLQNEDDHRLAEEL